MKLWNPIEAYRKVSQRTKSEQIRHEATSKIRIGDYTGSNEVTYTAFLVDGIPVRRITADNLIESELLLMSVRKEYYNKRITNAKEGVNQ